MSKTKQEYRLWAKEKRKSLDIKGKSSLICNNIVNLKEYKSAKKIGAFYPLNCETDIKPLFQDKSKSWFLPVIIVNEGMAFCKYEECSEISLNKYGICEPCKGREIDPGELDLIIIPALLADKNGHRLGYGKGYYDRFLAKLPESCVKIAPISAELMVESLPHNEHDVSVDIVVTQGEIFVITRIDST